MGAPLQSPRSWRRCSLVDEVRDARAHGVRPSDVACWHLRLPVEAAQPQILVALRCTPLCTPPRRNGVDAPVPGGNDFLGKRTAPYLSETPVVTLTR